MGISYKIKINHILKVFSEENLKEIKDGKSILPSMSVLSTINGEVGLTLFQKTLGSSISAILRLLALSHVKVILNINIAGHAPLLSLFPFLTLLESCFLVFSPN